MSSTTWDALEKRLDNVKKPVQIFRLCDDTDVRARYLAAKREDEQAAAYLEGLAKDAEAEARALVEQQARKAKAEFAAAKKAYDAHTVVLRFQGLERDEIKDLMAKHPPSEEEEANGSDWDEDTFPPALIAAASLDGMPEEAAARYLKSWLPSDARDLWNAAWSVQNTRRTDLGKG
ncbi:hypothetical protein P1P75_11960 [Streptomyces sp. ID05-39B]|uniref:hypothetical protein n=1 Tax=Streptomyces sp. ID05-39B TaxID=3028664 RepID=UPI0029B54DD5|nr:hypothetical protein [Streptomyces sp. ID05-39B]MDX3527138.1 hypothetical protein [Streptomyces sp. ID05-39B]